MGGVEESLRVKGVKLKSWFNGMFGEFNWVMIGDVISRRFLACGIGFVNFIFKNVL